MGKKKNKGKRDSESSDAGKSESAGAAGEWQQQGKQQKKGKQPQESTSQEQGTTHQPTAVQGQGRQQPQGGSQQQQGGSQQQQGRGQSGQNPSQGRGRGVGRGQDGGRQQQAGRGQQHTRGPQITQHAQPQQTYVQPQQIWAPLPTQQPPPAWGPPQRQQPPQQVQHQRPLQQSPQHMQPLQQHAQYMQPQQSAAAWGPRQTSPPFQQSPQVQGLTQPPHQQSPQHMQPQPPFQQHAQYMQPPFSPGQHQQQTRQQTRQQQPGGPTRQSPQEGHAQQQQSPQGTSPSHPAQAPQESVQSSGAVKKGQQKRPKGQQPKESPQRAAAESPRAGGDSGVVKLTAGVQAMTTKDGGGDTLAVVPKMMPGRRTGGTQFRKKIMITTNHFPLDLGHLNSALHYDVDIVPDKPKKLFRDAMEQFRRTMYRDRYPAFDGKKNLYSVKPLCESGTMSGMVTVMEDDRKREFKVTIKQVAYIDLSLLRKFFDQSERYPVDDKPMQIMQCIDVVLRSAPLMNFLPVGRSFFQPRGGTRYPLSDGTELYNGFYQSAIVGWKPFLNMDVTHKVFAKSQTLIEFINEIGRGQITRDQALPDYLLKDLSRHIKNLKVEYKLPNNAASKRVYRVNDIGTPARQAKFELTDDNTKKTTQTTVERYYIDVKRENLKYPLWPTLWVGSKTRHILIPCEFCTVLEGQAVNRQVNDLEKRNMIKCTATKAPERLEKITKFMKDVKFKQCKQLDEFGIKVSEQPQKVEARVLQPPSLEYSANKIAVVKKGAWFAASNFIVAVSINSWTILCLDDRTSPQSLDILEKELMNSGRKQGVNMGNAERYGRDFKKIRVPYQEQQLLPILVEFFKSSAHDLIVVVIPGTRKFVYHYVKQASELRAGRLTQCIKSNTVGRLNSMTTDNIMLKINAKLNGTNHKLSANFRPNCLRRPFVIMGADVTHPGPEAQNIPSVAAVTCSYDAAGFKYTFSWRLQGPKVEIIQDLEEIVKDQLMFFYKKNRQAKPENVFFFRDGVSDGQFQEVLQSELTAIRRACSQLDSEYKPNITFLVVQKRHHTRFFPNNPADSEDRGFNVPAGTCVDTEITHPSALDFYLVSHASIQGVARPTKYRILWDDSNMTEDEIESLTYYLCHLFARCNRSVSYPTPTYYAHLAAARGKVYCETDRFINMDKLKDVQNRLMLHDEFIHNKPMYFV